MKYVGNAKNNLQHFNECAGVPSLLKSLRIRKKSISNAKIDALRIQLNSILSGDDCIQNGLSLHQVVYDLLLVLAQLKPGNVEDPTTLEPIKPENQFLIATGDQFDIQALIEFHNYRPFRSDDIKNNLDYKWVINPLTNERFSTRDFVRFRNMLLLKNKTLQLTRSAPEPDNQLDHSTTLLNKSGNFYIFTASALLALSSIVVLYIAYELQKDRKIAGAMSSGLVGLGLLGLGLFSPKKHIAKMVNEASQGVGCGELIKIEPANLN